MSGFASSIMAAFRGTPATPAPGVNVTPPGAATNVTIPGNTTPQSDGSVAAIPAAGMGDKSPLDKYENMWKVDPNAPAPVNTNVSLTADPAKLAEAAKGINFASSFNQDDLAKASRGDAGALQSIIQSAAQAGIAHSAGLTASIVERALAEQAKKFQDYVIPQAIRTQESRQAVNEAVPLSNHPAFAPMVDMMRNQLATRYPTASQEELKAHAVELFQGFAEGVVTASGSQIIKATPATPGSRYNSQANTPEDWDKWFTS